MKRCHALNKVGVSLCKMWTMSGNVNSMRFGRPARNTMAEIAEPVLCILGQIQGEIFLRADNLMDSIRANAK